MTIKEKFVAFVFRRVIANRPFIWLHLGVTTLIDAESARASSKKRFAMTQTTRNGTDIVFALIAST